MYARTIRNLACGFRSVKFGTCQATYLRYLDVLQRKIFYARATIGAELRASTCDERE